ncbi:MAG: FAD-dependent monooxygenase [Oceanococcus sp.]
MKALIAGGGIGGLCAALCLRRIGWEVLVLEQASETGELGAGIQISPNGGHVLQQLGLMETLSAKAFHPQALEMRWGRSGRQVFHVPLQEHAQKRWGAPYLHLHRADLIQVLVDSLQAHAENSLRTNSRVQSYSQDEQQVSVQLQNGENISGDILIGADGIHSAIRSQMLGENSPRFTGNVAWRAVVPMDQLADCPPPPTACVWVGPGRHAVTYRVRGGTLANFVGVVEHSQWTHESWTQAGSREEVLADFADFHPCVRNLIAKASTHFRWALYDREPLPRWSEGRVALLGDACHPMLPFLAQGAAMAIEDAWVLSEQLQQQPNITTANQAYFQQRLARTQQVQAGARRNSRTFHHRYAATYLPIAIAAKLMPGLILNRFDWLYGEHPLSPHHAP